jgi:hypothetical protein
LVQFTHEYFHVGYSVVVYPPIGISFQFKDNAVETSSSVTLGDFFHLGFESLYGFRMNAYAFGSVAPCIECEPQELEFDRTPDRALVPVDFELHLLPFEKFNAVSSALQPPVCDFCSSGRGFDWGFLRIPPRDEHPCLRLTVPTAKSVTDFHRQVIAHAGRTTKKRLIIFQAF